MKTLGKSNFKIPKDKEAESLTFEEVMKLIEAQGDTKKPKPKKAAPAKKAPAKKKTKK